MKVLYRLTVFQDSFFKSDNFLRILVRTRLYCLIIFILQRVARDSVSRCWRAFFSCQLALMSAATSDVTAISRAVTLTASPAARHVLDWSMAAQQAASRSAVYRLPDFFRLTLKLNCLVLGWPFFLNMLNYTFKHLYHNMYPYHITYVSLP